MKKKLLRAGLFLTVIGILVLLNNELVKLRAASNIYIDVETIPHQKVGLVLGTSKYLSNGLENLYYRYRVEACYELYKNGKIDFVLVSGDNGRKEYNEPETFKADLVALGIPAEKIYLDYAGFRTLDSVVRAKEIFGQSQLTIISQEFHNERAIYLAKAKGIEAVAFNAKDPGLRYGFKTNVREYLARVKMSLDLYVLGTQPKYLGDAIVID